MDATTEEYLDALRKGDYLQALQWVNSLVEWYDVSEGDADTVLQLAIFELIHHGFSPEDFHHIQLLYILLYDHLPPFIEQVAYQATILCSAAIQCMVYYENDLIPFYLTTSMNHKMADNRDEILDWMQRSPVNFDVTKNNDGLSEKYKFLNQGFSRLESQAREIRRKINHVFNCQLLLQTYVEELAKYHDKDDNGFTAVRLGVINSLTHYLCDKTIMTEEVENKIASFVNKIQEMDPKDWEKLLLDKMRPKTSSDKPFVSWFFDKAAEKFQLLSVKMLNHIVPKVDATDAPSQTPQQKN
ncbi:Uncharacterised protein [Legionella lansingensis]|uniref:Uncharacterized protein n=1 Tax=Legionella lansingensis TaxID=45067 RepID=A0A0W0VPR2_9GAMM|nr:helical bundle domain-containing protein [Legionella lansingensis]KTD22094.1 hypothetical protein Llan_1357 [Legionella lansingensis]SNV45860.1 Uncharacterised protein [Legionella lansingensis]